MPPAPTTFARRLRTVRPTLVAALGAAALLAVVLRLEADPRRLALDDLSRIVRVSEPDIAPDGKTLAVLVSRVDEAENRYRTELVLVDARTGDERSLVRDRVGLSHPRFSPAGDRLAFLAEATGGPQIHVMPLNGGEASRITSAPEGVLAFAWRPDGKAVAFTAADPPEPRTGPERWNDAFEVGNNGYLVTAAPRPSHLWLVPAGGGTARRLTSGGWSAATSLAVATPAWSPDGRQIAFVRTSTAASGDTDTGRVHVLDVDSGALRALTNRGAREGEPRFSPVGARIAYVFPRDGDPANVHEAHVSPAAGGDGRSVSRGLDRSLAAMRWMPDGRSLLVSAADGTRVGLWVQPEDGAARRIDLGPLVEATEIALAPTEAIAVVGSEAARPSELYVLDSLASPPRRLTDFNREVASLALGRSEGIEWPTTDGLRADGVVTYPPDFSPGQVRPLVLYIHGGPTAASNEGFSELAQLMAARGWIVLQPNYRGSDNRGNAFQRAIAAGAGEGPGRDVMAGIEALKRRGWSIPRGSPCRAGPTAAS